MLNELDQRIRTEYANGTTIKETFDAMGVRTRHDDQNQRGTDYGHDGLGRLESVTPDVSIDGVAVPATRYGYDEVGNKITQTDANGHSTVWAHDYYGRITRRTLPEGMAETFDYDDAAHTLTHTDFNGDVTVTSYDVMGRVKRIDYEKDATSEVFSYWPNDQLKTVTDAQGVTEYVYTTRGWLDHEIKPDGSRLDYGYDAAGNRERVTVTQQGILTQETLYTYDALNRLETITDNGVTGSGLAIKHIRAKLSL